MLKTARASGRAVTLTTILFDNYDAIELACGGKKIEDAGTLDYKVGGGTALYDAYGVAIAYENMRKQDNKNPYPQADVLYLALTDGEENDSRKYNLEKLRSLMLEEQKRSNDGSGRREFAQITEFGVDQEKMGGNLMLEDKRMQTFFRGDKGLRALFQTVLLALKIMFEEKGITEKWKELSDKLPIGNFSLGRLKTVMKDGGKLLADSGGVLAQLETLSANGLTEEFQKTYVECASKFKDINSALVEFNKNPEIAEIMGLYVGKNLAVIDASLKRAVDKTYADISTALHSDITDLLAVANNPSTAAGDLAELLQRYSDNIRGLHAIPNICGRIQPTPDGVLPLEIRTNVISDLKSKEFNEIIGNIFNSKMLLLKDSYNLHNVKAFYELGEYVRPPFSSLLRSRQIYTKFCELYEYIKGKMPKQTGQQQGGPDYSHGRL
jgi:hypothetical protein